MSSDAPISTEPEKPKFVVYLRFPFPRNGFQDPESCDWSEEKSQKLRDYLSSVVLKNGDIEWSKLADHFQVSEPFILQQAIWLYEKELEHVRGQMFKINRNVQMNRSQERVKAAFRSSFPVRDSITTKAISKDSTEQRDRFSSNRQSITHSGDQLTAERTAKGDGPGHTAQTRHKSSSSAEMTPRLAGIGADHTTPVQSPQTVVDTHHNQPHYFFPPGTPGQKDVQDFRMSLSQLSEKRNSATFKTKRNNDRKHWKSYKNDDDGHITNDGPAPQLKNPFGPLPTSRVARGWDEDKYSRHSHEKIDSTFETEFGSRLQLSNKQNRSDTRAGVNQGSKVTQNVSSKRPGRMSRLYPYSDDDDEESGGDADDEQFPERFGNTKDAKYRLNSGSDTSEHNEQDEGYVEEDEDYNGFLTFDDLAQPVQTFGQDSYTTTSASSDSQEVTATQNVSLLDRADTAFYSKDKPVTSSMSSFSELSDASISKSMSEDAQSAKQRLR